MMTIKGTITGRRNPFVWQETFDAEGRLTERRAISLGTWRRHKRDARLSQDVKIVEVDLR